MTRLHSCQRCKRRMHPSWIETHGIPLSLRLSFGRCKHLRICYWCRKDFTVHMRAFITGCPVLKRLP